MKHITRRLAALAATPLLAGVLVAAPQAAQAADQQTSQAQAAGAWLADEVKGGLVQSSYDGFAYDDYGLTIDVLYALRAVGGFRGETTQIVDALEAGAEGYATSDAAKAKLLGAATVAGQDPTSFGGINLVTATEGALYDAGANDGRLKGDYSSAFTQSYAVQGLHAAGSSRAAAATTFLLEQQCTEGFFRSQFTAPDAPDQSCDGAPADEKTADTDNTAQAVLALVDQQGDPTVDAALEKALTWLQARQAADGSFVGSSPYTDYANADSTGLAARALEALGDHDDAARAAAWIVDLQSATLTACGTPLSVDKGAIGATPTSFRDGLSDGINENTVYEWRKATADAAPALLSYDAPPALPATTFSASTATTFVAAGSTVKVSLTGLGDKERFCVDGPDVLPGQADASGKATITFTAPSETGRYPLLITGSRAQRTGSVDIRTLAAKKLTTNVRSASIKRGATQHFAIRGLASGESVTVSLDGRKIRTGTASSGGVLTGTFTNGVTGKRTLKAVGQFSNRNGSVSFTVTK